jgi:DNA repair exonuclease SbcCD ATPase subunit
MEILRQADSFIRAHEEKERELSRLSAHLQTLVSNLQSYPTTIHLYEEVRTFLQTLAEATRNEIMSGLQEIVTRCLQSVFGPHLSFEIEVETKRNNTGIEFYVVNTAGEHTIRLRPEDNMGGGVIDTISIGLRFGLLKVLTPSPKGPIFLDEPAKMVSGDRIESIANLLKELADLFDKQIIMVTHHQSIMEIVDSSIHVRNENGRTLFT